MTKFLRTRNSFFFDIIINYRFAFILKNKSCALKDILQIKKNIININQKMIFLSSSMLKFLINSNLGEKLEKKIKGKMVCIYCNDFMKMIKNLNRLGFNEWMYIDMICAVTFNNKLNKETIIRIGENKNRTLVQSKLLYCVSNKRYKIKAILTKIYKDIIIIIKEFYKKKQLKKLCRK